VERVGQRYQGGELVVVIDCARLERAALFWCSMLGYVRESDAPEDGHYQTLIPANGIGIEVLLQRVPEPKVAKNRVHLDLRTADLEAEVERARAAGASVVTGEPIEEYGWRWHVLTDPDSNEFCVLQPPA
jgi:predicted enzyme related to lactoylglutathione lyase